MRGHYVRMPDLEEAWVAAQDTLGGSGKFLRKYAAFTLLVIDEWLLDRPTESMRTMLLELMERRYGETSTVFCTQYSQKDWHQRLGSGVHADAIMDRIIHNTIWVKTGNYNMRRTHSTRNRLAAVTEGVSGARPRDRWRSLARTPALNRTNRWRSKLQILSPRARWRNKSEETVRIPSPCAGPLLGLGPNRPANARRSFAPRWSRCINHRRCIRARGPAHRLHRVKNLREALAKNF